jgi:hypothetical protein
MGCTKSFRMEKGSESPWLGVQSASPSRFPPIRRLENPCRSPFEAMGTRLLKARREQMLWGESLGVPAEVVLGDACPAQEPPPGWVARGGPATGRPGAVQAFPAGRQEEP